MSIRVSASVMACLLSLSVAAQAGAQLVPTATPAFDPPARPTFSSRAPSLFEASQIADRPTSDLRPRFHWGVFGSFVPNWTIPGSMGNWFFEDPTSPKMSGRDLRVGVVRARQVGFEMGASFVRKTVSSLDIEYRDPTNSGVVGSVSYTAPNPVHMMGVDAHLVVPFAKIGERVQLGILAGGGIAWLPNTPIQARLEGPPFYADATSTVPLSTQPSTGGYVRHFGQPPGVPVVTGTRYGIGEAVLYDVSPTEGYWMLLRGQLAADFLIAPPLKIRVAGGFNYPGVQAIGIDAVYLFRTGRVGTGPSPAAPGAAQTPAAQIADRPDVLALRRSYWGVLGGITPKWWTPETWGRIFEPDDPDIVEGREFRVGITRGRPLGYEFGVSFVMQSLKRFTFIREGLPLLIGTQSFPSGQDNPAPIGARITLSEIDPVKAPGAEFHSFIPIGRIGQRVQIGGLLGIGGAHVPKAGITKHIEGPPYVATATNFFSGLATVPPGGGFVVDENGQTIPIAPGQTGITVSADATTISPLGSFLFLARGQIAADVLMARPFKLRFSGGFNYPGAQLFGIEAVYLFGTGR